MAREVIMPALELAQERGTLLQWLRQEGETVSEGEPLIEIETDKATVEIEAPASGVLARVRAQPGDEIPVGHVIAWIVQPGESAADEAPEREPAAPEREAAAPEREPAAPERAAEPGSPAPSEREPAPAPTDEGTRLQPASPRARRLARERGVELSDLAGTGPGEAVVASDVEQAAEGPGAGTTRKVGAIWRRMAQRMVESWSAAPHFYLTREVSAERLVSWRRSIPAHPEGAEVTLTDLLVALVAASLKEHPRLNARWDDGTVVVEPSVNVGVAVAVQDGLVVPVVHDADLLSVLEIAERRSEMVSRAKEGRLRVDDVRGGSFTISNLGMYGVDAFEAIVNPPQAAILAVGRVADRVVAAGGNPAVKPTVVLTLSCDHRAVDGARAAMFLSTLADLVEEPLSILS